MPHLRHEQPIRGVAADTSRTPEAEQTLGEAAPHGQPTEAELNTLVTSPRDIVGTLRQADRKDTAEIDAVLGISLT